jgi:hypothetical protein
VPIHFGDEGEDVVAVEAMTEEIGIGVGVELEGGLQIRRLRRGVEEGVIRCRIQWLGRSGIFRWGKLR